MKDVEIIGMLKSFVKATLVGMGALKGAPCQCVITTNADGTHKVTMMWVDNEGDSHTSSFDVLNGQVGDLEDLGDVEVVDLQEGETLAWDATNHKWVNTQNSATVNTLNAIGDVTITSVQDGEVLVWDDTASKWVNKALTTSDISGLANVATSGDFDDLTNKPTTLSGYGITNAYTKTETDNAITAEIEKLDVGDSATAGSYITAVSEANGKISVTRETADVTPTANSKKMLTSGGAKTALDVKQDTLTFDNAPTENSNNPVKSGGVYTANRNIYEVIGALGAKNYLQILASGTTTTNGITFVVNDDGTITVSTDENGATADTNFYLNPASQTWVDPDYPIGDYILSGCPAGGSDGTYRLALSRQGADRVLDTGTGTIFTHASGVKVLALIQIGTGTVLATPIVFKPMVRLASDTDPTYQPYAKTNKELTSEQGYCTEDQYTAIQTLLS